MGSSRSQNRQYRIWKPQHDSGTALGLSLNGDDQPVVQVSWNDAAGFCSAHGFRLPTEGEWELAARGGLDSAFPWQGGPRGAARNANVMGPRTADRPKGREYGFLGGERARFPYDDSFDATAKVGSFLTPNAFGLHDAIGNAAEWCSDWFDRAEYERCREGVTDPRGPDSGDFKVARGGTWAAPPAGARSRIETPGHPSFGTLPSGSELFETCREEVFAKPDDALPAPPEGRRVGAGSSRSSRGSGMARDGSTVTGGAGTCEHCGYVFAYQLIHNGFNRPCYAYCAECGMTALLDTERKDPLTRDSSPPSASGLPRHRSIRAEGEGSPAAV